MPRLRLTIDDGPGKLCARCGLSEADVRRERRIGGTYRCWYRDQVQDRHVWYNPQG